MAVQTKCVVNHQFVTVAEGNGIGQKMTSLCYKLARSWVRAGDGKTRGSSDGREAKDTRFLLPPTTF